MKISRRNFLGTAIGSAAVLPFRWQAASNGAVGAEGQIGCAVLDLKCSCVLPESLQGYGAALPVEPSQLLDIACAAGRPCRMAIVPGLGAMSDATAKTLADLLKAGTLVVLESGAAFLSPAEFTVHQKMLDRYFGVEVGPPINLWSESFMDHGILGHRTERQANNAVGRHKPTPYVNYAWPRETKVRDFSRVIPVSSKGGEIIGRVRGVSVALKRRTGNGILVFLGSPLGPALGAADPEALSWVHALVAFPNLDGVSGWSEQGAT